MAQSAGDFDYETNGAGYSTHRRPDPRIAALVHAALGDARTVINVGAGAGSYEPDDRAVTAVEPSASMRSQRPTHRPAIDATAEDLPFDDHTFDAAMATITIHQWNDLDRGLRELRRVTRGPVVILTADGTAQDRFWLVDYAPSIIEVERRRYPAIDHVLSVLGGTSTVTDVPIPADCLDGFTEAYYARPELLLDPAVRAAQSGWGFVPPGAEEEFVARLSAELENGEWKRKYGEVAAQPEFIGSFRLLVAHPE